MSHRDEPSFFHRLITPMIKRLRHLAGLTQKEQTVDDLKNEAWILAEEIKTERGCKIEPEDEELQSTVIARLYQRFGQFVNREFRHAVRLDQEERDADGEFMANSVFGRLAGPELHEPEFAALLQEGVAEEQAAIAARFSEAVAYFQLFDHFDGDSAALAGYFAITSSMLNRRVRRVEQIAREQPPVFDGPASIPSDFMAKPGVWCRKRAVRKFHRVCGNARPSQLHLFLKFGRVFGPAVGR